MRHLIFLLTALALCAQDGLPPNPFALVSPVPTTGVAAAPVPIANPFAPIIMNLPVATKSNAITTEGIRVELTASQQSKEVFHASFEGDFKDVSVYTVAMCNKGKPATIYGGTIQQAFTVQIVDDFLVMGALESARRNGWKYKIARAVEIGSFIALGLTTTGAVNMGPTGKQALAFLPGLADRFSNDLKTRVDLTGITSRYIRADKQYSLDAGQCESGLFLGVTQPNLHAPLKEVLQ